MAGHKRPALSDMPHWPRLLSEDQAAAYVGVSPNTFRKRVGERWPKPIKDGTRNLYDRKELNRAVDDLSRQNKGGLLDLS